MYTITDLYDLDHTLAKDYLSQFTYPWEALKGIKDMIIELGKTLDPAEYDEVSTVHSETYEVFDFPIVEEETQPLTEELSSEVSDYNETEPVVEAEEKKEESSAVVEDDEGSGSKGGKDPEAYEDKRGDEAENESKGQALEKGQLRSESEGEYAGFKVFELETNGKIGFNPDSLCINIYIFNI